jgi:FlaG/FlaF family flagellin (archaellin)
MKRDTAVASVLSVIVLIALAIIGPAIIPFEFEMSEETKNAKVVAITAKRTVEKGNNYLVLTNHGGKDTTKVTSLFVTVSPPDCDPNSLVNGKLKGLSKQINSVGKCALAPSSKRITVTVVGEFTDGTRQLLLDTTF